MTADGGARNKKSGAGVYSPNDFIDLIAEKRTSEISR